jgi:hypothetical protein
MSSLLTLSDVMGTGHHAGVAANVGLGRTVAVVGDGAVELCGLIAARRLVPGSQSRNSLVRPTSGLSGKGECEVRSMSYSDGPAIFHKSYAATHPC